MFYQTHSSSQHFRQEALSRTFSLIISPLTLLLVVALCSNRPALASCGGNSSENAPTNAGTEFLLCFEQNIDSSPTVDAPYDGGYLEIYVATQSDSATITFTSRRYPTLNKVVSLAANSSYTYRISDSTLQAGLGVTDTMNDLWMTSSETPDDRVVMVRSTAGIVCYGLDYKWQSADAVCALPANDAGTDYRVMSYENSVDGNDGLPMPSQFAVAAFEDSTLVTITPACATAGGHPAGMPFTVLLQKGQGVQVQTDGKTAGLDLTGSKVSANHPIVVYGSHSRTEIPHNWERPGNNPSASRDMLLESMPPTSTWGSNFVLDAIADDASGNFGPNGDMVRVLALGNNTSVTVNGQPWTTLGADQFADTAIMGPMMIQSTGGSILVGEYMHSQYSQNGDGDPFLAIVPPVDQSYNNYTFVLPSNQTFSIQYVIIATNASSQGSITLDGQTLPSAAFTPVPGAVGTEHYSILEDNLTSPTNIIHTISTMMPASEGFTILGYGLGNVVSYGYTAGSLLVPQRTIAIDPPPQTMGGQNGNWVDFRNTSFQPAYLDSAVFVPDRGYGGFGIHPIENIAYDIRTLDVGQGARVHFTSERPLVEPIRGTVTIYAHTANYTNLEPATVHFTLYPGAASSVTPDASGMLSITAWASPNPFTSSTNIHFSIPASGDITISLYDELGRAVQHVSSGNLSSGSYSVGIERRGLAAGVYTCEIVSRKLNINERVPVVVGE